MVYLTRLIGFGVLAGFLICTFTRVPNRVGAAMAPRAEIVPADAIVVLGAGVNADETLSDESTRRTIKGISLYRAKLAPLIIFSGPAVYARISEAQVRANLGEACGIPDSQLLIEADAHTTREEADQIAAALASRGVKRILLVSNAIHLLRARLLFEKHGFTVFPAPSDPSPADNTWPLRRLSLTKDIVREVIALAYYRSAGFI